MTGELPPETPLEPGEPIPHIRKRVGAEFNISQNLFHKARNLDEEKLSGLELELELQKKIVKANLKLANEMKLKKSVRKKRLQSYQDAIQRLKELEKKWLAARQMIEGGNNIYDTGSIDQLPVGINYLNNRKIGPSLPNRPKSSLALAVDSDADQVNGSIDNITSKSAPSTPRVPRFRNINHQIIRADSPTHNISNFRAITTNSGRFDPIRPSSIHFPFDKDSDENEPERCKTAEHFSYEFDAETCSLGSGSSVDSNVLRFTNGSKRKNILSLLHPVGSRGYLDINSHLYTLPTDRGVLTSSSEILRKTNDKLHDSSATLPSRSSTLSVNSDQFTRHNSLERLQPKNYGNLINSGTLKREYDDHLYQNQGSLTDLISKSQTSLPPPPDMLPSSVPSSRSHLSSKLIESPPINMASRPLPSPPASSPVSSPPNSPCSSPSIAPYINHKPNSLINHRTQYQQQQQQQRPQSHHNYHHHSCQIHIPQPSEVPYSSRTDEMYQNVTDVKKVNERLPDITSRAVRSSIIRTPAAISSNDLTALSHIQPPSSHQHTRYQDPLSLIMPSPNDDITYTARSITIPPDSDLTPPTRSFMSPAKTWTETDLDACPSSKSSGSRRSGKVTPASSCITTSSSSNASTSSSQKFFDPSEFDTAFIHQSSEEADDLDASRPQFPPTNKTHPQRATSHSTTISLSPNLPPSNGPEVNVVSVGHFQPYWEEVKPYELSDFFKYSAKHRSKAATPLTLPGENKSGNSNYNNSVPKSMDKIENKGNKSKKAQDNNYISSKNADNDENTNWYENEMKRPTIV